MNITLKQIASFQMVAATRSFTRAAEELGLAQPVLSSHVKELELHLGARLFDRTTRSVELTTAGVEFFTATADIMPRLHQAVDAVRDVQTRRRGRVAVAAPPLLAASLLPPAMARFRAQYPQVEVALHDVPTEAIVEKLLRGDVEIGVATMAADDTRFARTVLLRDRLVLLVAASHPAAAAPDIRWSDLASLPLVMLSQGSGIRLLTDRAAASAGLLLTPAYEVHQVLSAMALVKADLGVAVLPNYATTVTAGRPEAGVAAVPIVGPVIQREIAVLHLRDKSLSAAANGFVDVLRIHAARLSQSSAADAAATAAP